MAENIVYDPRCREVVPTDQAFSENITAIYEKSRGRRRGNASDNPWALQPDTLGFLEGLLEDRRPSSILEFGSGESTGVLAAWAANNESRLFSVENDARWVKTIKSRTPPASLSVTTQIHSPLKFRRHGLRLFFTYRDGELIQDAIRRSMVILIDGPHFSGREDVLYEALNHCAPGTVIVVDDYNVYCTRDMLLGLARSRLSSCFVGAELRDNSHGLFLVQSTRRPGRPVLPPSGSPGAIVRSYWRCWRDSRLNGTGAAKPEV